MRSGLVAVVALASVLGGCNGSGVAGSAGVFSPAPLKAGAHHGIHKIKHVVVIMQENRSFDSYFGTFPGAAGLPRDGHGNFTSCVPDPRTGACDHPFHD